MKTPPRIAALLLFAAALACAQSEAPQERALLPEIQALWTPYQSALKAVEFDRDQKLKNLDYIYMLNLDKMQKDRSAAGDLDGALAAKAELGRLGARQETTADQIKAMNPALQKLRAAYDTALKNYQGEAATSSAALLRKLLADLEEVQRRITTTGDLEKALQVKAEKERIAAEAAQAVPEVKVASLPVPEPVRVPSVVGSTPMKFGTVRIADATKGRPFVNSLGMEFVPVPGTQVLFCRWETRVKDYAAYAQGKKVDGSWAKQERGGVPVGREPEHPVCAVIWEDANAFCEWLTKKESGEGKLPKGMKYRLPTDAEWSRAVGLAKEEGATPKERGGKNSVDFPWGTGWPPPKSKVGNYADTAWHEKFPKDRLIEGYTDGYATTAPVGSFAPNTYGIYDLGGNVWEWCEDLYEPGGHSALRGASWGNCDREYLLSSYRARYTPEARYNFYGFRCVVGASAR